MTHDRFTKTMLVVIALLLGLNLMFTAGDKVLALFESKAQAQVVKGTGDSARMYDVRPVRGFQVTSLKEVSILGDGKPFIVSNPTGFMVYQIDAFN
jgi:hypothetical protein